VTGTVDEVVANTWDPDVDDPATRGGTAVSIIGDDGVRYYLAHFQLVDPAITPGARVVAGDRLGEMGDTGRTSACHVHFGLSLPCDNREWWVRRGVIWPDQYLSSWRDGGNLSPLDELNAWFAEYPEACSSVESTPYPVG
jgi:murein DD-endopeptidase MepM/ murein hydrolase activator NlpD